MIEVDRQPERRVEFRRIINISAKTNLNVENLCSEFREIIDELDEKTRKNPVIKLDSQQLNSVNLV